MSRYYVDKSEPESGYYEILPSEGGHIWRWREVAKGKEYIDDSRPFPSEAEAYRDAASDWEENGNSSNRRLGGILRAAATRAEKST
jgi:hypothetical protein